MKKFIILVLAWNIAVLLAAACTGVDKRERSTATGGETGVPSDDDADTGGNPTTTTGPADPPECPHQGDPIFDPNTMKPCPSYVCAGGSHCVPHGALAAELQGLFANCDSGHACVPDNFIETNGNFLLETCTAILGLEGRCLSSCIPQVTERGEYLEQDVCAEHELCVPCYDPLSGESTGACGYTCDPGPSAQAPPPAPSCCTDGGGTCVPMQLVPPDKVDSLAQDACPDAKQRCVPNEMLDPTWDPEPCAPGFLLQLLGIDDGVCLPACVDAVKNIGAGSCDAGYKCAPCDALGEPTGACDD